MKLEMLALYDAKVEAFMSPFFAQSVGAAVRELSDMVNGARRLRRSIRRIFRCSGSGRSGRTGRWSWSRRRCRWRCV